MGYIPAYPRNKTLDESRPRGWRQTLSGSLQTRRRTINRRYGRRQRRRFTLYTRARRGQRPPPSRLHTLPHPICTALINPQLESQKWTYQTTYLAQWQTSAVDAVILPITPWVGYRPKTWVRSSQWLGYTAVFNLLNYAAVTVPVGRADAVRDAPGNEPGWEGHVPRNEADGFNWRQCEFFFPFPCWLIGAGWVGWLICR